jgi:cobalt-zinc-cadmium efflux system membrane fusion protein
MSLRALLVMSCVVCALAACGRSDGPAAAPGQKSGSQALPGGLPAGNVVVIPADSPQMKQLRVEAVQFADVPTDELVAPARVTTNPNLVSRVLPPVQGRILRVMVKFGDSVEKGQPVMLMESPDADAAVSTRLQAEATQRQARATLTKVEADVKRATELYEVKAVAEKDLLQAQNELAQARGGLEAAEAALKQSTRKLEILGLKPGQFNQPLEVRAPISGKVLEVNMAPGEYRAGVSFHSDVTTPLLTIADLSTVWVTSDVPEPFIRLIHMSDPLAVSLISFPDETFVGRVIRIGDVLDPQTRTLKVYLDLPNPQGRLRPEMFGTIRHTGPKHTMPVVPATAVIQEYGRDVVFLERAPGQFERRGVQLGPRLGNVAVVRDGLTPGERVVVEGAILLKGQ